MKKAFKWVAAIILLPIVLFFVLAVLLYLPPVQNWAVRGVAAYASEQTGLNITVKHVRLAFPLDLSVEGFRAIGRNDSLPQVHDTIADVERLIVDVRLLPLFSKQIEIDALEFNELKMNTANFIHEARVKGSVGRLFVSSHGINLGEETVRLDEAVLSDANVTVELSDTVPEDTTKSENFWKINVDKIEISNTKVALHLPGDTLQVAATMGRLTAADGHFDLYKGLYEMRRLEWSDGALDYDNNFARYADGLDFNHISLTDVNIAIDTLHYCSPDISLMLSKCAFKEKSGLTVERLEGPLAMDSLKISAPELLLRTPDSFLDASIVMDMNAFDDKNPGKVKVAANASFGKQDIMLFLGGMPSDFIRKWPNNPLMLKTVLSGNMKRVDFSGLDVELPTAFDIKANGVVENPLDANKLFADVKLSAHIYDIGFVTPILPAGALDGINIPYGIEVDGKVLADGKKYSAKITATEGGGQLKADATFDASSMRYAASVDAAGIDFGHFLPNQGLGTFTGHVKLNGSGTELLEGKVRMNAEAAIEKFRFGGYNLDNIKANVDVANNTISANVNSNNELLKGIVDLSAIVVGKTIKGTVGADIANVDFYNLRLIENPLSLGLCGHLDFETDTKEYHKLQGFVGDITLRDSAHVYRPKDISMDLLTSTDTTFVAVSSGDFVLKANVGAGYKSLSGYGERIMAHVKDDMTERRIDYPALRALLPRANVYLKAGQQNFFSRTLAYKGISVDNVGMDISMSPDKGINGDMSVGKLVTGGIQIDTVYASVKSDETTLAYHTQVRNYKNNPDFTFNAFMDGKMLEHGVDTDIKVFDEKEKLGLKLGIMASMEENGLRMHVKDEKPVLGYKEFSVNKDNYLFMANDQRVSAKLDLIAGDGQGVQVYSNDDNENVLQDLTLSLNKFDLEKIMEVIPYVPRMTGVLNGDVNFVQTTENMSFASSIAIDDMTYEKTPMGNLATEFVYLPKEDGSHSINGILISDDKEVATIDGTYSSSTRRINAKLTTDGLPLSMANGFISDHIIGFYGTCEGELSIKGSLDKPVVDGELYLDSCYMASVPYGLNMRFSNDPVRIVGSNLLLENFEMFAYNSNPINVAGNVDFSDMDHVTMNVRMRTENCQIIRAKENLRSVAFGNVFVNFFGSMRGPMDNLAMRGKLDVLASTDMSYILRDSPISTDNQLEELVKFTDFTDTTQTVVQRPPITGFDMNLTVNVDQGAHIMCYLNSDHSNYLDLVCGGNMRMRYNVVDDVMLTGRLTLNSGEMKYSLPVIPLKTFDIQDGSYIEFTGEPMNPKLNITATERVKSVVSAENGQGHPVDFDCGVVITRTLDDMGLEFILDAPEDVALHNELQSMSMEQRGKLAVTMLTTGMYLADGNTSGFTMNGALSSFLQNEINNITGNALRTLDLSFGMDNATDAGGRMHTDYSFKFAKRFWNNRMKISVGGKVSTGPDVTNQNESFFDNVTLEYRLDNTANKYVKLFFDNNSYDWLEGYTQEYGVGFVWRRSLQHFSDIFRFKEETIPIRRDTLKIKTDEQKQ